MDAEKIICCDRGNNDALAYAAMANNRRDGYDPMAAMMMGNSWQNNPFMYLILLAMFGGNGFFGNGRGLQGTEIQSQIDSLRTQLSDNQNSNLLMDAVRGNATAVGQLAQNLNCDFNQLQNAVSSVQSAIQQVSGQVGFSAERVINAAQMGDAQITSALQNCCCQTQQSILKMGYENQLAIQGQTNALQQNLNFVNSSVERGFSAIGYQSAQDKCDIIRAGEVNTQRIVDTINNHWQADLQQKYNDARLELSQQRQNAELIAALKTTTTTTA